MEDRRLIYKLNRGSRDALCRIYEKYRDDLVRIAAGLLNNVGTAEDVVQDVFLMLVHSADKYKIRKNLKGYLTTCVANKARNLNRGKCPQNSVSLDDVEPATSNCEAPDQCMICDEDFQQVYKAMAQLPYEQKEAVILHIQAKMKFREIAKLQTTSTKTTLSRYNYGLNKLRSMLNSEVEK
ncbi:MAG: sigma-70 family RNA polymerase sigma factor [Planctomycetes bacterium]|nr:sigma-70 family RNA polymerase sigma factor [Planctomycetota bacterium]